MLVKLNWSCVTRPIDVKMDESVYEEKSLFKMLGLSCTSELNGGFYITLRNKKKRQNKEHFIEDLKSIKVVQRTCIKIIHNIHIKYIYAICNTFKLTRNSSNIFD